MQFHLDSDTNSGIIQTMVDIDKISAKMRQSPFNVKYGDLCRVCDHFFGAPRQKSTSHRIYKVNWIRPPLINIQNLKGKAKEYQVRQVLDAIDKSKDEE